MKSLRVLIPAFMLALGLMLVNTTDARADGRLNVTNDTDAGVEVFVRRVGRNGWNNRRNGGDWEKIGWVGDDERRNFQVPRGRYQIEARDNYNRRFDLGMVTVDEERKTRVRVSGSGMAGGDPWRRNVPPQVGATSEGRVVDVRDNAVVLDRDPGPGVQLITIPPYARYTFQGGAIDVSQLRAEMWVIATY